MQAPDIREYRGPLKPGQSPFGDKGGNWQDQYAPAISQNRQRSRQYVDKHERPYRSKEAQHYDEGRKYERNNYRSRPAARQTNDRSLQQLIDD